MPGGAALPVQARLDWQPDPRPVTASPQAPPLDLMGRMTRHRLPLDLAQPGVPGPAALLALLAGGVAT